MLMRRLRRARQRQLGLSLIELLVAMSTGLAVVGAGLSFLSGTLSAAGANLLRVRMHQDLQSVMDGVSRDLSRAGEWALADEVLQASTTADLQLSGTSGSISANALDRHNGTPAEAFAFANAATALRGQSLVLLQHDVDAVRRYDLRITGIPAPDRLSLSIPDGLVLTQTRASAGSWSILNPFAAVTVNDAGTCVLLRYDLDGNGVQGDDEHFGFRLNVATSVIQTSTTATSCTQGNWDAFTDPNFLRITAFDLRRLRARQSVPGPIDSVTDTYVIGLEGRLARAGIATRRLQHVVQARNIALE